MTDSYRALDQAAIDATLVPGGSTPPGSRPIWLVRPRDLETAVSTLGAIASSWVRATGFKGAARSHVLLPDAQGNVAGALPGVGDGSDLAPSEPAETLMGLLPTALPPGDWHLATPVANPGLAALAWMLGSYR